MSQYVCVRITRMDGVDIALFDYDRYNTLYYFLMNADEQIYMRYGGRGPKSPTTYLDLNSLEVALGRGLELHEQYKTGKLAKAERPQPMFPRDIPAVFEGTTQRGRCVECHLIGDFRNVQRQRDGSLDRLTHIYRSPDIKTIGIDLDVPKGLVVAEAREAARAVGMKQGDRITHLNGVPVWTFADLQYQYDKVQRDTKKIRITVERAGEPIELPVTLPEHWWWTDLTYRQWSVEPRVYFKSRPLTRAEKRRHGLDRGGFASQVTAIEGFAEILKLHQLKTGDIVFAVDGVKRDETANTAELFIKLRKKPGDTLILDLLRQGKRMRMEVKTTSVAYRK